MLAIIARITEFERELIQERMRSGLPAAKARGKRLGRQPGQRPKSDRLAAQGLGFDRTRPQLSPYSSARTPRDKGLAMRSTRLSRSGSVAAVIALSCGLGYPAFAQEASLPEQIVDIMNQLWGQHAGIRANHAKGVVVEGAFAPTKEASTLSKAALFRGEAIPVTARFSDSTGIPDIPDGGVNANPHGMSLKFHLADGGEMDIVANSLKFFPVATGDEFRDLLQAVVESGPDAAKPTKLDAFLASHPAAARALALLETPVSFARETYNGIDAFIFVDAAGNRRPFRFQIMPVEGDQHLSQADAAKQKPDFLMDELSARLANGPVRFRLMAQLAEPGDPTSDPSQPWPPDRKIVDLGTITLTKAAADNAAAQKMLLFLPGNLTEGIEVSDDSLIDVRNQAYAVSFGRRSQ
jgi:catalase